MGGLVGGLGREQECSALRCSEAQCRVVFKRAQGVATERTPSPLTMPMPTLPTLHRCSAAHWLLQ